MCILSKLSIIRLWHKYWYLLSLHFSDLQQMLSFINNTSLSSGKCSGQWTLKNNVKYKITSWCHHRLLQRCPAEMETGGEELPTLWAFVEKKALALPIRLTSQSSRVQPEGQILSFLWACPLSLYRSDWRIATEFFVTYFVHACSQTRSVKWQHSSNSRQASL